MPDHTDRERPGKSVKLQGSAKKQYKAWRHARSVAKRNEQQRKKRAARLRRGHASQQPYFIEKRLRIRKPTTRKQFLSFPTKLNLEAEVEETLKFVFDIRKAFFTDLSRHIQFDHSTCESISPEVALLLIAEITRCHEYSKRCSLFGNRPKHEGVQSLLGAVGYLAHFGMPWKMSDLETRQFLVHFTERQTRGVVAKELVQHFAPVAKLDQTAIKALGRAIIECMDNVSLHAYPANENGRFLRKQWWLLGYRDMTKGEISLCFYDQGVGIPKTIRTRWRDQLSFLSDSDADLIVRGVTRGYSSTQNPTRGRGLPKLKLFIDNASNGELRIVSDRSSCTFKKGFDPTTLQLDSDLDGTMVIWRIEA